MIYQNMLRDLFMRRNPWQMPVPGPPQMSGPGSMLPQGQFQPFEGNWQNPLFQGGKPNMGMNVPNMGRNAMRGFGMGRMY